MREEWDVDRHVIEEALEKTGAILRCEVCDEVTDNLDMGAQAEAVDDLEEAYGRDRAQELIERYLSDTPEECRCV